MFLTSENRLSVINSSTNVTSDEENTSFTSCQISPSPYRLTRKPGIRIKSEMKLRLIYGKQTKIQNSKPNKSVSRSHKSLRRKNQKLIRRSKKVTLTKKHPLSRPKDSLRTPLKKILKLTLIIQKMIL
jgi:hypothetical protein